MANDGRNTNYNEGTTWYNKQFQIASSMQSAPISVEADAAWDDWESTNCDDGAFNAQIGNMTITNSARKPMGRGRGGWGFDNDEGGRRRGAGDANYPGRHHSQRAAKPPADKGPELVVLTGEAARKWEEQKRIEDAKLWANFDFAKANELCDKATAEKWAQYPAIVKAIYEEHPEVAKMTSAEADAFRKNNHGIVVQSPPGTAEPHKMLSIPNPIPKFEYAFVNYPEIRSLLLQTGFEKPSPIQSQAWPLVLSGQDMIGIAQTGTGKTLAFLLPAYVHIMEQPRQDRIPGAHVLIMAPTRELAIQIHAEVVKFNCANLSSVVIYGGADRRQQIREIERGCNVIIATPGRLDDLISAGHIDITTVTFVVLDEADRMLDAGFEAQIRKTMYQIRPDRQTIMTSATWPNGVQRLANSYMCNPVQVVIGTLDLTAVTTIKQSFVFLDDDDGHDKLNHLLEFIGEHRNYPDLKVIVFTTTKHRASYISSELAMNNVESYCIRGDMDQSDRELAIQVIKSGEVQFLIATDVASRGIDIPDLTHVINLDFPRDIEEYVHRIGRTGRAGKSGKSVTFFTFRDSKHAKELIKILEKADQPVPGQLRRYVDKHDKYMERRRSDQPARRGRYDHGHHF